MTITRHAMHRPRRVLLGLALTSLAGAGAVVAGESDGQREAARTAEEKAEAFAADARHGADGESAPKESWTSGLTTDVPLLPVPEKSESDEGATKSKREKATSKPEN